MRWTKPTTSLLSSCFLTGGINNKVLGSFQCYRETQIMKWGPQSHAEAVCVHAHMFAELGVYSWRHTALMGEENPHEMASGWRKIWDRPRGEQCGDPNWKHSLEMGNGRCFIGIRRISVWLCRHSLSKQFSSEWHPSLPIVTVTVICFFLWDTCLPLTLLPR